MGTLNEAQVKIEEGNIEKEWMKEGVWLREEDTMEMIESLMEVEDSFIDNGKAMKVKNVLVNDDEYGSMAEILFNEETAMNVMVPEEEKEKSNNNETDGVFSGLPCLDEKWCEAHSVDYGGNYDLSKYNWCFEDDTKMWELTWYPYNTNKFPWDFIEMLNLMKQEGVSNY